MQRLGIYTRYYIATWNVRSLGICEKLENIKLEMKCHNIDILGMSEIKWPGQGDFWSDEFRVIFSGDDNKIAGVGIIMNKDMGKRVNTIIQYNHRIIAIKIDTKPVNTFIIHVYHPYAYHGTRGR